MNNEWRPFPGGQTNLLQHPAFEVLYGGVPGTGKTDCLLLDALPSMAHPSAHALFLRRTLREIDLDVKPRSMRLFHGRGVYDEDERLWEFQGGGRLRFGHCTYSQSHQRYLSVEFTHVIFDELRSFDEEHYTFLFSRARSVHKLPCYVRAGTNPPLRGTRSEWVRRRWLPWVGTPRDCEEAGLPHVKEDEILWFRPTPDGGETLSDKNDPDAWSRGFVRARESDNPLLQENDPGYRARLGALSYLERMAMGGDWNVLPEGLVFKREWFKVKAVPEGTAFAVRYWDLAASIRSQADYCAGAKIAYYPTSNCYRLLDLDRFKLSWPQARQRIIRTALADGRGCDLVLEDVGFQRAAIDDLAATPDLRSKGIRIFPHRPVGDKLNRALVWSALLERGELAVQDGPWLGPFIDESLQFGGSDAAHDDQIDAVSGAVAYLSTRARVGSGVTL